jgi:glycosyltransferase involved in cell wall biosynthesis
MLLNKVYYLVKPLMPWRLRMVLRRMRGRSRRASYSNVWPIDPKAGAAPAGWPGWPDGKQFAFVLTHDVESSKGLARVESLMEVEASLGFRSSFNFVPEGEYRLADQLRFTMEKAGFEVGVHGLKHDGKLYASKAQFAYRAARIRAYAQKWGACGFRSPLMQHKLNWQHLLGMEYDASTFDTDPFEPEPDGVGTIFPFWVPGPNGTGYVELPYTLVQDFSLFVILGEQNIDIWKNKVDWVAGRGGMVLLNTHPDYMCFDGSKPERDEFPVSLYAELLSYIREKYEGKYWSALPRDVSRFYCANVPISGRNTRKKICMVAYTDFARDNRLRRYAEALVERGDQVDVIGYTGEDGSIGVEEIRGVTFHKVQRREVNERSKWTYAWRLLRFMAVASGTLTRLHRRMRYDVIHAHNPPDFTVFTAWYAKWTGAKVILDVHDVVPEFFASKFGVKPDNFYVRLLKTVEKAAAAFADRVIVANHIWEEKLISRSVPRDKSCVYLNHVDPTIFSRRERTRADGKIIVLFPGSFQWHQGLDLAIEAFAKLIQKLPNSEFHLYGDGGTEADLRQLVHRLGLNDYVKFHGGVPVEQIVELIANADLGIVPKRADSFGNEAYSTKIMEFMSQGVPVVVSRTKIDSLYFDDTVVRFFESGNTDAMAETMLEVIQNKPLRDSLIEGGYRYVDRHGWHRKKHEYVALIDSLSTESFDDLDPILQPESSTNRI